MSEKPPSIIDTANKLIDETAIDGLAAGVVAKDGQIGAEVSGKADIGKPGGWTLGGIARWTTAKGKEAAAYVKWQPGK